MPWSEKDLFEVELFDPPDEEAVGPHRSKLPGMTVPLPDEAMASWLLRYAEPFGVAPEDLLVRRADIELAGPGDWWRRPPPALVEYLAQATGIDAMTLAGLTLWPGDEDTDDPRDRFSGLRFREQGATSCCKRRIAVCPRCLANDLVPYVRRDWTAGWAVICPDHAEVLAGACPECGCRLKLPLLSSRDYFAPDRCPRCGFRLTAIAPREAHPAAVALHRQLREAHDSGAFTLHGGEQLAWPIAIALFDVLLGAIWIDTRPVVRRRLFERIERDFGHDALGSDPIGSYEGLLILAWILEGWPDRVRTTIAIVQGRRPRRQLDRWRHLDGATRQVLLDLLLTIWPDQTRADDRAWWRDWIENLPETADELRARAAVDRFPVDFRGELTQARRIFPSRIDPCLNLFPRHRRGGQRSDRHGVIERHPALALPGSFPDPGDLAAHRAFTEYRAQISACRQR